MEIWVIILILQGLHFFISQIGIMSSALVICAVQIGKHESTGL